jgi:gamma-butyrobetaine dioxygenase
MLAVDRNTSSVLLSMADLAPMRTPHAIVSVEHDDRRVTLVWSDGLRSRFHAFWLRDNCACPACRHPQALERTHMFVDHAAPAITSARVDDDQVLEMHFQAGEESHVSRYTRGWLRNHDHAEATTRARRFAPRLWDASVASSLPTVQYADYTHTNDGLRQWIEAIKTYGIVLLRGVPQEPGRLLEVARRIGPVRASNFGEYYDVVSMPNPNASAYTAMGLELHTDLANWRTPPDVQLLSCVKSSVKGGESVFADGFRVAETLRAEDPAAFELLSRHPIEFRFHDDACDIRSSSLAIELDHDGSFKRVRFNNWLRAALPVPEELVEPMYAALGKMWRMLRDPKHRLNLRLEPGDLIAYNNNRVMHGRAPFDPNSGERHLQGCYLNQEDVDSTLRLLDRLQA